MVTFTDLVKEIDAFVGNFEPTMRDQVKKWVMPLVQKAVEHGEAKDQSKIAGILTSVAGMFLGKKG